MNIRIEVDPKSLSCRRKAFEVPRAGIEPARPLRVTGF